jgi:hypothetical protein
MKQGDEVGGRKSAEKAPKIDPGSGERSNRVIDVQGLKLKQPCLSLPGFVIRNSNNPCDKKSPRSALLVVLDKVTVVYGADQ